MDDTGETIPDYQESLAAFHQAFGDELQAMIGALPIKNGNRVLDLACGDGRYAVWLADRVGPDGRVVAVDLSGAYLTLARQVVNEEDPAGLVRFVEADVFRVPLEDGSFDLAWCARSLRSLPDAVEVLRGMARLVCPGGAVAVLEEDALHHLILPWPEDLELALRQAELEALAAQIGRPRSYYAGRRLPQLAREAGLERISVSTRAIDRWAPLAEPERAFIDLELAALRRRVTNRLDPEMREVFHRLVDPDSDAYLPARPDFTMTCIERVVVGHRPAS
ncbi:class I SAM-dependent methyltransferase [Tautonia rosea]|uniref:class I SAM-dependent methyltransferase n=1 Tax=Tautonia rosea TaxID=2728037 RepID=UPI0014743CBB|nr:methyltransferase domain-containing protein [Tautonia rosea]